jgi:carboxyl-terminal processing protease
MKNLHEEPPYGKGKSIPVLARRMRIVAFMATAIVFVFALGCLNAAHPEPVAVASASGVISSSLEGHHIGTLAKQKEELEREKPMVVPFEPFLKDPSFLGFSPDFSLFKKAYFLIKTQYVTPVEDSALIKGCEKEVNRLLKEAKAKDAPPFHLSSLSAVDKELDRYTSYVKKDLLYYAAIEGMFAGLNDPYSVLLIPREFRTLQEQMQSATFGGLGIYIELDKDNNNALTIFEPIEGTPASRAGLQPQDAIAEINGESTKGMALEVAVAKMRGQPGTTVTLTIKRPGAPGLKKYPIIRETIKIHSVTCKMISNRYGYIRIRTFGEDTGSEVQKALTLLGDKHVKGIILDLRNNGGGYIDASVKVCSQFVPSGGTVVSVTERTGQTKAYNADQGAHRNTLPLLLLVNRYSASASEITAGAIQDYKIGQLMGEKTYGKGSVQQIVPYNGAALKVTTAHYLTPKGRNIDKLGIDPDIEVKMEPKLVGKKDVDEQLKKAVIYMDKKTGGT